VAIVCSIEVGANYVGYPMPLIVIGADTAAGEAILETLGQPEREVRVFVTDEPAGLEMRNRGFKVATGDVSDESHIEAASMHCFSAVLIAEAATDRRQRSFASTPDEVLRGWAKAVGNSGVNRVIWVTDREPPETGVAEVARVDPSDPALAEKVLALDDAHSLG